jgi:hypothetical protein
VFSFITGEHPIMLDDTCYFLSFDNSIDAIITTALLNSSACIMFLKSIAFLDSKRPYTKEVLKRIDIANLLKLLSYSYVRDYAKTMDGNHLITKEQYSEYKEKFGDNQLSLDLSFISTISVKPLTKSSRDN